MTHTMVSLDLPVHWQRAPEELMYFLKQAAVTSYKVRKRFPGRDLERSMHLVQKSVLPGSTVEILFDNKENDIPQTVLDGVMEQYDLGATFSTVHAASGNAVFKLLEKMDYIEQVIAVTVPTSMPHEDIEEVFGTDRPTTCKRLARIAAQNGVDKFVCAAADIACVREAVAKYCKTPSFWIPAIRPTWFKAKTDQIMVATPTEAVKAGADRLIVGRPILDPCTDTEGNVINKPGDRYKDIVAEVQRYLAQMPNAASS